MSLEVTEFNFKLLDNLADELVKDGLVSKDQLAVARVSQKNLGGDLGRILAKKGFASEDKLREFVQKKLGLTMVRLDAYTIDPVVIKIIPQSTAQKFGIMPVSKKKEILTVAVSDPLCLFNIENIKSELKCKIRPILVTQPEIDKAINTHYRLDTHTEMLGEDLEVINYSDSIEEDASVKLEELASGSKIISAVNNMIFRAYQENASDIHVEPMQNNLKIRYRVDGILEERMLLSKSLHLPIVSRLKILGGMDIAEKRIPQDGRVRVKLKGENLDLRLSTYPTMHGEKMVLRLLAKENVLSLEDLGFSTEEKEKFVSIINAPYGIFLVTGPTGSGKTTTLYAALQRINSQEVNIVSIEDPIENEIPGVNQAQVNPKAGVTFASALRSILRQDPDVIMVGEIRDGETADIAVRSAMTGHLVFSTLHTNTAVGAIARLMDLGVEPFLISSALLGVMAQRLVRKICPNCKEEIKLDKEQLKILVGREDPSAKFFKGRGCEQCRMSGYLGRTGLFELLYVDDKVKGMVARRASEDELKNYMTSVGVLGIREIGIKKVYEGVTTVEEVLRVTERG